MEANVILPKEISTRKMSDFVNHITSDLSASESIKMIYLGSKLGLYKAMAYAGPLSAEEVVLRSAAPARIVEEWLKSQTERGYIYYNSTTAAYTLPTEHAIAMTDSKSPFYIGGRFLNKETDKPKINYSKNQKISDAGSNSEEQPLYADASSRFFSTEYLTSLFGSWLPGVEGLTSKLQAGITVADLGCGRHGASTLVLAEAFPASRFYGFDKYASSVERANLLAKEKKIRNVNFNLGTNAHVHANLYDLITLIECLHHMGTMPELLAGCYQVLKPDGVLLVIEAKDKNRIREEHYQRMRSAHGLPGALKDSSIEVGVDVRKKELEKVARASGFTGFREGTETIYDTMYELRP
ncbi:hypothetical protein OB13_17345 [Pontibacter sp. HJ8]